MAAPGSRALPHDRPPRRAQELEGILSAVNRAIFQHRITELWYRSLHESRPRKRTVEPYRIVLFGTSLYVVAVGANDEQRQPKSYKLDRISRAKPLDQRFQPRGNLNGYTPTTGPHEREMVQTRRSRIAGDQTT